MITDIFNLLRTTLLNNNIDKVYYNQAPSLDAINVCIIDAEKGIVDTFISSNSTNKQKYTLTYKGGRDSTDIDVLQALVGVFNRIYNHTENNTFIARIISTNPRYVGIDKKENKYYKMELEILYNSI